MIVQRGVVVMMMIVQPPSFGAVSSRLGQAANARRRPRVHAVP